MSNQTTMPLKVRATLVTGTMIKQALLTWAPYDRELTASDVVKAAEISGCKKNRTN